MLFDRFGWRHAFFATVMAASAVALPALAEDTAPATGETLGHGVEMPAEKPKFEITIPTVQTVQSSIDETTIRAVLTGDLASHAEELAKLDASSIRIPEFRVKITASRRGEKDSGGELVVRDLRLTDVAAGIAKSIVVGGVEFTANVGGSAKFGQISAEDFDMGTLLGFFGLVQLEPVAAPKTLYRNLVGSGGSITTPDTSCTLGSSSVARVAMRPPKMSFPAFIDLLAGMDKDTPPEPKQIAQFVDFYSDMLTGIEISPSKYSGFSCAGLDDEGKPVAVKVGPLEMGAYANGHYPEITVSDIAVAGGDAGTMSLGKFHFKGMDILASLQVLKSAGDTIDESWLEEHYRELIPQFAGFDMSNLAIDIPDADSPGERIKATLGNFDLGLNAYVNGIPTDVASSATHAVVYLPKKTTDESLQQLLDLGIDHLDLGYDAAVKWDETASELRVNKFAITAGDLGSVAAATVIGQATRDLFSNDLQTAAMTAMSLTLKQVSVEASDEGLADIILREAAKRQKRNVTDFRHGVASLTQGTILLFLGDLSNASEISKAVADFINGAKSLSIKVTSKAPDGVPFADLAQAQDDPAALAAKVNIEAVAK